MYPARRETAELTVSARRRRDRRLWRNAFAASLLVHLLVLFWGGGRPIPLAPFAAAGPKAGDARAAAGGVEALNLAVPPRPPVAPAAIPLEVLVEIEPADLEPDLTFDMLAVLGEPGPAGLPGLAEGDGEGDGGTAQDGLQRVLPPTPRGMIFPPANKSLRGTEIQVWVFVDEHGRVVPDSTRLNPPTRDRGFNRQLIREAAQWMFRPGTRDGQPVATWTHYKIEIGSSGTRDGQPMAIGM